MIPTLCRTLRRPLATLAAVSMAAAQAAPLDVDLPAQALADSIKQLARAADVSIGGDGRLFEGKTAPAVKGWLEPLDALNRLLAGSGLVARAAGDGSLVVARSGETTLREVSVVGDRPKEGSAEAGYRPETATTTGPWGTKPILDTPYSIYVVPSEWIENTVTGSTDQIFMMSPSTQPQFLSTNADLPGATIRGFSFGSSAQDGIRMVNSYGMTVEELDRVEILSSLNGFLYGGGTVGGMINYILKRPTPERLVSVTAGNYGGESYFVHADLGGPIDAEGRFGYRLNLLAQDGETAVKKLSVRRGLVSGALDWRVTNGLLLQVEGAHRDYRQQGGPGLIRVPAGSVFPPAPDAGKGYGNPWIYNDVESDRASMAARWTISDTLTLRAAYRYQQNDREFIGSIYTLQPDGTLTITPNKVDFGRLIDKGGHVYLDARFSTASIEHKLTVGASENRYRQRLPIDNTANGPTITGLTFDNPYFPEPAFAPTGTLPNYTSSLQRFKNLIIGDDIRFSERWSVLVGANHASIETHSFNTSGVRTGGYDKAKITPSLSLIYKPAPEVSTYATYIESLEAGQVVSSAAAPPYRNAGEVLPPTVSKQVELGVKASLGRVLLTSALYRIDKANTFDVFNSDGTRTLTQDGRQVHQGIELGVSGKATDRLTLYGGGTLLNAEITKTNTANLLNKVPYGIAEKLLKLYAEYQVLAGVDGFTLTGGAYWVGKSFADDPNLQTIPAYTVADLGLRYEARWGATPLIARLNVTNVADKSYWQRSTFGQLGLPRTVAFSVQAKF